MTPSGSLRRGLFSVGDLLFYRGIHRCIFVLVRVVVLGYTPVKLVWRGLHLLKYIIDRSSTKHMSAGTYHIVKRRYKLNVHSFLFIELLLEKSKTESQVVTENQR